MDQQIGGGFATTNTEPPQTNGADSTVATSSFQGDIAHKTSDTFPFNGDGAGSNGNADGENDMGSADITGDKSGSEKSAPEKASEAVKPTMEKASALLTQVQNQAMTRLEQQKGHTAGDLTSVAEALRKTGQELREKDAGIVASYASHYTETAANQVENLSGFIKDKDVNQLLTEVEDFAQREPAIFIAGAFLLGLAGARFLRVPSSSSASSSSSMNSQNANSTSF